MATSPAGTIATAALDTSGITAVTSAPSASDPRLGQIYDSVNLAGAQPVWFHSLKNGKHLMLAKRTWSAATPVGGIPGVYSAFTEDLNPRWFIIDGSSGSATTPHDGSLIPIRTKVTSPQLMGACSRPQDLMWLVHSVTIGGQRQAVLQHWDIAPDTSLSLNGEEVLPSTATVVFDKGIQYVTPFLNLYGTDVDGNVYRARKTWQSIGTNRQRAGRDGFAGQVWQYYTGTGWTEDVTHLAPMQDGITSAGPLSFALYRNHWVMTTVDANATVRSGRFWTANSGRPWIDRGGDISLGDTGSTYLGGGIQMQPLLGANPANLDTGVNAGLIYLTSQHVNASGHHSLVNSWDLRPVTLVG